MMSNFQIYKKILEKKADELLELINGPIFLARNYCAAGNEILVSDADDAVIFACDQDVDIIKGVEYQYWTNLLENHARTGDQLEKEESLGLGREFKALSEKIFNEKIIPAISGKGKKLDLPESLIDVAVGNFYIFLMNRVLLEEQSYFDEYLYVVYQKGGIPCGWKGSYPEGSMLVFSVS
ncbi:hypothetical protein NU688_07950 [Variovorax sp. ZS18.2.2]|uniref:hypothetical protein n=1 Tax=Variovorax sp. ZS18.2.2 TaxID=2971255 RepID=UPI002150D430|nr:hypothetical protein [Variovorax sp. ZS18.2.2]MCR6476085.1 hypothetical protein [Variovorax sp. ZS18.2.2]